ncbi:MAG: zinc-ribbon domain-containing protein [Bacilli bacterium]
MELKDKTIVCKDCGEDFTFTVRDQEFYAEKGFTNEPVRCKACRDKKKAERGNGRRFENNNRY